MPRKKPFSGKQKKEQLKDKKLRKKDGPKYLAESSESENESPQQNFGLHGEATASSCKQMPRNPYDPQRELSEMEVQKINLQPKKSQPTRLDANSFRLHFFKESDEVIKRKKKDAQKPVRVMDEAQLEYRIEDVYPSTAVLDFPKRPPWSYNLSKEKLDSQEKKYFNSYLQSIINQPRAQDLSYFELNLETWRQLWRVTEISDILVIIADIRCPVLYIPPTLVHYVCDELHKDVIVVLNKVDLVPASLAVAWKLHLLQKFPGMQIVFFSSCPRDLASETDGLTRGFHKKEFKAKQCPLGPSALMEACKIIVKEKVDLSSWEESLEASTNGTSHSGHLTSSSLNQRHHTEHTLLHPTSKNYTSTHINTASDNSHIDTHRHSQIPVQGDTTLDTHKNTEQKTHTETLTQGHYSAQSNEQSDSHLQNEMLKQKSSLRDDSDDVSNKIHKDVGHFQLHDADSLSRYKNGVLTLGMIGYPNVGKSSVLNALVNKKVVSVSGTPGRTKHLQTIFLSPTVRLCDCPGLVFPSMVPKSLQVVCGMFPVAQVREPYSVVGYVAKRLNLARLLGLQGSDSQTRSPLDICEAWAEKSGFRTAKASRPDVYRAANKILRMVVSGELCLTFRPPEYCEMKHEMLNLPETAALSTLLKTHSRSFKTSLREKDDEDDENSEELSGDEDDDDDDNYSDSLKNDVCDEIDDGMDIGNE